MRESLINMTDRAIKAELEIKRLHEQLRVIRKARACLFTEFETLSAGHIDAQAEVERLKELLSRAYGYTTNADDLLPEEIRAAIAPEEER
jgi:uncharacterized membrane protein